MKRMLTTMTAAVGVCALLGSPAAARQYESGGAQSAPPPQAEPRPDPGSEARQEGPSRAAKSFIEEAAADGQAEVKLGELAKERASSPEVKEFAEKLVKHHKQANESLERVAAQHDITPPQELNRSQQKTFDKLSKLSGEEFDREYVKAMVKDHKKAVKKFERQAERPDDPAIQQFASSTLPTLEGHLAEAQRLEQQLRGRDVRGTSGTGDSPGSAGTSGIDDEGPSAPGGDDINDPGHSEPPPPSPTPDPSQRP